MESDGDLLRRFAGQGADEAFTQLVRRHYAFVYRTALRRLGGSVPAAEDVAQRVFTDLARKAGHLSRRENMAGWLHTSARFAATDAIRAERRRQDKEMAAARALHDSSDPGPVAWERIEPWLDEALAALPERDREALLLHFFEERPFSEVGLLLALSTDAARMRVNRALDRLRVLLARRGITSTTAVLGEALLAQPGAPVSGSVIAGVAIEAMRQAAASPLGTAWLLKHWFTAPVVYRTAGALALAGTALFVHHNHGLPPDDRSAAPASVPAVQAAAAIPRAIQPAQREPVHVAEERSVDELEAEASPVPLSQAPDPSFHALTDREKRILKVLWSREIEFGNDAGKRWAVAVAADHPNYNEFVSAREELRRRGWVRVGRQGRVFLSEAGLAYCIAERAVIDVFPMPNTKPAQ